MQEKIFRPIYSLRLYLVPLVVIPITLFLLWEILFQQKRNPENILGVLLFGPITLMLPSIYIRRIVFTTNSFSIEKFLWPTKTINYSDVVDIGLTVIKTQKGSIGIGGMVNFNELQSNFADLLEQGKMNHYQIENKLVSDEIAARAALLFAAPISVILWFVSATFWDELKSINQELSCLIFFGAVYFPIYLLLKRRSG